MEFLTHALDTVNIPYTFLILLVALYWIATFLGVFDLGSVDVDVDIDADADAEIEASGGGALKGALQFFHIGEMPIMIIISFFILFLWVGSVLTNFYLNNNSLSVAAILVIPLIIVSLLLTKVASLPFVKVFQHITKEDDVEMVGKVCVLKSLVDSKNMGLAEVRLDNVAQSIYVITQEGIKLQKGEEALVIMKVEGKKYFLVEPHYQDK